MRIFVMYFIYSVAQKWNTIVNFFFQDYIRIFFNSQLKLSNHIQY